MARDNDHNPDPNANAARIVKEAIAGTTDANPASVEAAWEQWAAHIQNVDERGRTLLRAAFEAGYESGRSSLSS